MSCTPEFETTAMRNAFEAAFFEYFWNKMAPSPVSRLVFHALRTRAGKKRRLRWWSVARG